MTETTTDNCYKFVAFSYYEMTDQSRINWLIVNGCNNWYIEHSIHGYKLVFKDLNLYAQFVLIFL